ncbi:MAG: hypothetical protein JST00_38545 [Deltaproteobacteria bacterium]|nr:hypothetical protein [Deltaproteobacteria bacterium]
MKLGLSRLALAGSLALAACAPARFAYAPVATTSADFAGNAAASYSVPQKAPSGEVHVAVLGVAEVRRPRSTFTDKAIRVSLVVENRSAERWLVDGAEQHVELVAHHVRTVLDVRSGDDGRPLLVEVPPGSTQWVDLLFLVPEGTDERLLGALEVLWSVRMGSGEHAARGTRFQKMLAPPTHRGVERTPDPYAPLDTMPSSESLAPGAPTPGPRAPGP